MNAQELWQEALGQRLTREDYYTLGKAMQEVIDNCETRKNDIVGTALTEAGFDIPNQQAAVLRSDTIWLANNQDEIEELTQLGQIGKGINQPTNLRNVYRNLKRKETQQETETQIVSESVEQQSTQTADEYKKSLYVKAHNAQIELMDALSKLTCMNADLTQYAVTSSEGFPSGNSAVKVAPLNAITWFDATKTTKKLTDFEQNEVIGLADGYSVRIVVDKVIVEVTRCADGTSSTVKEIVA